MATRKPSMRYVIEFGCRKGAYTENLQLQTSSLAARTAAAFIRGVINSVSAPGTSESDWKMPKDVVRLAWQSPTHFLALSKLDGVMRGPASTKLWSAQDSQPQLTVCEYR